MLYTHVYQLHVIMHSTVYACVSIFDLSPLQACHIQCTTQCKIHVHVYMYIYRMYN